VDRIALLLLEISFIPAIDRRQLSRFCTAYEEEVSPTQCPLGLYLTVVFNIMYF